MNDIDIRMECLRLAIGGYNPVTPKSVVEIANEYYAFVHRANTPSRDMGTLREHQVAPFMTKY